MLRVVVARLLPLLAAFSVGSSPVAQTPPEVELREVAGGAGLRYAVQLPAEWTAERWAPLLVTFAGAAGEAAAREGITRVGAALPEAGWVVVAPVLQEGAADLAPLFAALRRAFRIEQGGMHALLGGGEHAVRLVGANRHQFQTISFAGPIDAWQAGVLQGAAARRVRPAGTDLAAHFTSLHAGRAADGESASAVARTLDDFHDAAANGDADRYFAILPDDAVFLGTDGAERWTGARFRAELGRYFERDSAWTYVALQRHVTVAPGGEIAWFDEVLDNDAYGECRGTGVLAKRGDRWVLRQYDLTVPMPNELARAFAQRIRALQDDAAQPVTTVMFVRHAEKVDASRDPALSDEGRARAEALAVTMRDVPLAAVFHSEFARTRDTVAPLCAARSLAAQTVPAGDRRALVRALRQLPAGANALVCGHSNTVPELLKAIGVAEPPAIADDEYDRLFVVTLAPEGARCLSLRYR